MLHQHTLYNISMICVTLTEHIYIALHLLNYGTSLMFQPVFNFSVFSQSITPSQIEKYTIFFLPRLFIV